MKQLTMSASSAESIRDTAEQAQIACIELILKIIEIRRLSLRELATRCGIHKSRLGIILHRNPSKRTTAHLLEIQLLMAALNISPIQVSVQMEASLCNEASMRCFFNLLESLYVKIPAAFMQAFSDIQESIDLSAIREEWSDPIASGVAKKLIDALLQTQARRDSFAQL